MNALLDLLIRLFPRAFRQQFGADLHEQVRVDLGRAERRGRWPALAFTVWTGLDLIRSAVAERLRPTWVGAHATSERVTTGGERTMTMGGWTRDLLYATRALRRAPGFTAAVVVTLGLAVGANAGIFSVISAVLLDPLPFEEPDRLVYIAASAPGSDFPDEFPVSMEFYVQYAEQATLLDGLATFNSFTATLRVGDRIERVRMSMPTHTLFETLGAEPILGRLPEPEDGEDVAVISYALWTTWFGSDPDVIGKAYEAINLPRTIIGVMRPDFRFPNDGVLLWIPSEVPTEIVPGRFGRRLVGRLAPGAEPEDLATQLQTLASRLPERFGGSAAYARLIEQHRPVVRPLREELLGHVSGPLWVLMGSVALVLLIACANVANLFLVRTESRRRDLAVRRAMGAGRGLLIRTQMAEAVLLAAWGGALGVVLAWVGTPLLLRFAPTIPRGDSVAVEAPTLLFALGLSALAAIVCGLAPAVRASAPSLDRLRDAGRGHTRRRSWGRDGLVVAQTALALVLLVGSGLLVRSFVKLRSVDPGYDTEDIFTFQIAPESEGLSDGPEYARFHTDFMERVASLPGVESVGVVGELPLDEGVRGGRFVTEDRQADEDEGVLLNYTWSGGDYFSTMGIEVRLGRAFRAADTETDLGNALVSETAANLLWPDQDPIGRRLRRERSEEWATVVGVVEDVKQYNFRDAAEPLVYLPLVGPTPESWTVASPGYVVKTARAEQIAPEVRALVREVAPSAPMYAVHTMASLQADSMHRLSFTMLTLALASGLALLMGAIGLYGVLSYVVALRTQEIGVRMALGARAGEVRRMVVARGARIVAFGIVLGLFMAAAATRALGALLFATQPLDGITFLGTAIVLGGVGLLASYVPARRASSLDPAACLRAE